MQSNYQCEKSVANGTLRYSMTCTSSSSSGQFVGGNCSITGLSSSVSEKQMAALMLNSSCREADLPLPVTTQQTKKDETWTVVLGLTVFAVIAFLHICEGYQLLHRWCSYRLFRGYSHDIVSRLRCQLAMESFARYFLLAGLTVAFYLAAAYHRLYCRLEGPYWFAVFLVCTTAQLYTVLVILDLKSYEELPDGVFESGRIDRYTIEQLRKQKENERRRAAAEERQRNCTACRGKCRYCDRPLDPLPQ